MELFSRPSHQVMPARAWFSTLLATIIAGVIVYWFTDGINHWCPKSKMGPLLLDVGLDHNDIAASGWVSLARSTSNRDEISAIKQ